MYTLHISNIVAHPKASLMHVLGFFNHDYCLYIVKSNVLFLIISPWNPLGNFVMKVIEVNNHSHDY